jgi:hypothetical protein
MAQDMTFYQLGEMELPPGQDGRELHFFVTRKKVEVWSLPPDPPQDFVQQWLDERRRIVEGTGECP